MCVWKPGDRQNKCSRQVIKEMFRRLIVHCMWIKIPEEENMTRCEEADTNICLCLVPHEIWYS